MTKRTAPKLPPVVPAVELCVHLLGLPLVEQNSHRLDILRREVRALLYRLAVHLEPVSREQLCFLFWPDTPEISARRALSHLLTHLRTALTTTATVIAWDDHVGLEPNGVRVDTVEFARLSMTRDSGRRLESLQKAVELYRGPFLSSFSLQTSAEFEAWSLQEQHEWERLYLESLAILIEAKSASGEYQAAIKYAQRYLAVDDLAEEVHRQLIELYIAIGDRASAARQFEVCAATLSRELGVGPQPMTWASYQVAVEGKPPILPYRG